MRYNLGKEPDMKFKRLFKENGSKVNQQHKVKR
jgi:hypothetical protein